MLPAAFFPTFAREIVATESPATALLAPAAISTFSATVPEGTTTFFSATFTMSFTGNFHTYRASIEINVLETTENLVNRVVFHFKEGIYALQVDFADGFPTDLRVVADVAQDVTTGEFIYRTQVDEQSGIV